jgi:flagellar basal-body rod protein FlgB
MMDSTSLPVLEQVLQFTQQRHGVLAGNLANLDTPGYRVRDLSPEQFQEALREAVEEGHRAGRSTSDGEYPYLDHSLRDVKESMQNILFHDQSDGSLEHQITEIAKNQMQHNLALSVMISQFRLLHAAISEQVT